jgi:hypothetical protein
MNKVMVFFSLAILALSFLIIVISHEDTEKRVQEAYSKGFIEGAQASFEKMKAKKMD